MIVTKKQITNESDYLSSEIDIEPKKPKLTVLEKEELKIEKLVEWMETGGAETSKL